MALSGAHSISPNSTWRAPHRAPRTSRERPNDVSFLELNRGLSGEGSGMFPGFENVASRGKMDEFALSGLIIV